MKQKKTEKRFSRWVIVVTVIGILLTVNLAMAMMNPRYAASVSENTSTLIADLTNDRIVMTFDEPFSMTFSQGGVKGINIPKAKENAEKAKDAAEGTSEDAPAKTPVPKAGAKAAPARKKAPTISPEVVSKAMVIFQESLVNRDVIEIGQQDKVVLGDKVIDKPYISSSFRDNPFDMVQEVDINPTLDVNKLPPEPFYPPPGSSTVSVTAEEFKKYVEGVDLQGVIVVDGRFFAVIKSGARKYYKTPGDEYKEKFVVNVDDVTLDAVLISDEYGNKGILDYSFRRGFQIQPIDNSLYITNIGEAKKKK